jgi:hypothetical protein
VIGVNRIIGYPGIYKHNGVVFVVSVMWEARSRRFVNSVFLGKVSILLRLGSKMPLFCLFEVT